MRTAGLDAPSARKTGVIFEGPVKFNLRNLRLTYVTYAVAASDVCRTLRGAQGYAVNLDSDKRS